MTQVRRSPPLIVVADDEMLMRMAAAMHLSDAGFEVAEAEHAEEVLALIGQHGTAVRLLFTDIHMPGAMDGLALANHVSRSWPWIAVLVASGRARPRLEELPSGSRFIPKPYELDHVLTHVQGIGAGLSRQAPAL